MRVRYMILASILIFQLGCAVARLEKESPDGGRVQVTGPGNRAPSGIQKAQAVILKKCPNGYQELERGIVNSGAAMGTGIGGSVPIEDFYIDFKCK